LAFCFFLSLADLIITFLFFVINIMFLAIVHRPLFIWKHRPEIRTSSIDWAQLSRLHLKTEAESSLLNVVFWKTNRSVFLGKDRMMNNVQKHNICSNVSSLHTFRCPFLYLSLFSVLIYLCLLFLFVSLFPIFVLSSPL
jgi:hypothetical protein